jgi:hypothetical protein
MDLFDKKKLDDFSKKVKSIFNLLTISRKYKVIGSAGLKNNKYVTDYDLNELYKQPLDTKSALNLIYNHFKIKFKKAEENPEIFITDFKCGLNTDSEPLRWDKKDMKKGFKILADGRKIDFQDCILQKTTLKLDMVSIIDGKFVEFSDNYLIKLGNEANFFPHDLEKGHTLNNLKKSFEEYFYIDRNLFKGLKRCFNYYLIDGEKKNKSNLTKLLNFFNSKVGLLNQIRGEISTIILVLENKNGFRKPKIKDVKRAVEIMIDDLDFLPDENIKRDLKKLDFEKAEKRLFDIINRATLDFILKNKDVVLF